MKKMNLFDLVSVGVASIIGAGIFSMLSTGVALTGRSIGIAVIFSMTLMCLQYVRAMFTASMFSLDGGMYAQQALIVGPILAGCGAFMNLVSALSYSIFGISISNYLVQLFPALEPYRRILSLAVLTVFFLLAAGGVNIFAKVQNLMAVFMYIALTFFVVFGLPKVQWGGFSGEPFMFNGVKNFCIAIAIMSFACDGAFNLFNLQGVAKNSKRNIPLSFFISSAVAGLIYFFLGTVAGGVLPYAEASATELGGIAQAVMPKAFYLFFVVCGAMFAIGTTLLGGLIAMPAPIVASAEDGWLPGFMKNQKIVYLIFYATAIIPVIFDVAFDVIVSFVLVPGLILGVVCNFATISLPKRFPEAWEKCDLKCSYPVFVALIVLSILGSLVTAYFSVAGTDMFTIIGNAVLTIVMFTYATWRVKSGKIELKSIQNINEEQDNA